MKDFFSPIIERLRGKDSGFIGALTFFVIALLWVIFGFSKMLFILIMTAAGYTVGVTFFRDMGQFRKWLDRLFPPGHIR